MRIRPLAAALLCASAAQAQEAVSPIIVTASRAEFIDTEAPYASEVHTREAIQQSGAVSLSDYLDRYTSVAVMPAFGNPLTPKIDMRGYGIGDGYQNVVVTLDGRRLNNIDMTPQLLGAVPLASIERIEIIKGSGSVVSGDAAMAGAIHIHTRDVSGVAINVAAGSHGLIASAVSAGVAGEHASLSVTSDNYRHDGFRDADPLGQKDSVQSDNARAMLRVFPLESVELRFGKERTRIDNVYGGYLTLAQFNANPAQHGGLNYNGQEVSADVNLFGTRLELSDAWSLDVTHSREDKTSEYAGGWASTYENDATDLAVQYARGPWNIALGWQEFDGARADGSTGDTSKHNTGYYLQAHHSMGSTTYSLGVRSERIEYTHAPASGADLKDEHEMSAFDVGLNHRLSDQTNVFANYNSAYQAPDIDRFFTTDWTTSTTSFNGFISPARARTVNLGANHLTASNTLKATLFYARLENEIFYYSTGPWSGLNTNIDESHKYGLELQDTYRLTPNLTASLNYAYVQAIIDSEDQGGGAFDGKDLPGVSPHKLNLGLHYSPSEKTRWTVNHTWRSEAYAANDFANTLSQKQDDYHATGVGFAYRFDGAELFAQIDNVFERANGQWIEDDVIYPVNFERTWRMGLRAEL
ncbi:MAG: TonB-dependent receptor [Gammaproteobacteria bacterium]|nr:TonB-dependent receptor [Gammaproteobacteria bacterium]